MSDRAAEADRAQHAELRLPLVGEHEEDVDEQQDPGEHRERAERRVELRQRLARCDRRGRARAASRRRRSCWQRRQPAPRARASTASVSFGAGLDAAAVRDERRATCGGAPSTGRAASKSAAIVPGATNTLFDVVCVAAPEAGDAELAAARASTSQPLVESVRERRRSRRRRRPRSVRARSAPIAASPGRGRRRRRSRSRAGSPPNSRAAAKSVSSSCDLVRRPARVPSSSPTPRSCGVSGSTPSTSGSVKPAKRSSRTGAVVEAVRGDDLVDRSELLVRARADRRVERVADDERARHDRGAEQATRGSTSTVSRGRRTALRSASRRSTGLPNEHEQERQRENERRRASTSAAARTSSTGSSLTMRPSRMRIERDSRCRRRPRRA